MTHLFEREARQDERRELYRAAYKVLGLPMVPVRIIDGRVAPLMQGRPGPSIIDYFGRGRPFRDDLAAIIVRDNDPVVVLRGPALGNGPSFRDPVSGETVTIYARSARPLNVSSDHVAVLGYVVVPDASEWTRPLPDRFEGLPFAPVIASRMEKS